MITVAIVVTPAVRGAASFASARPQRVATEGGAERAGFLRRTGLDAAIAVVAVFGLWQMVRAGSVTATGRADPLLVAAPALGIIAISLLLLRMFFGAAAAMAERAAAGRRGVVPALAGWELSRRPGRLGRISVLVVLATAVGTFTAVHLSSLRQSQTEQGDARVSADLVVTPGCPLPLPDRPVGARRRLPHHVRASPGRCRSTGRRSRSGPPRPGSPVSR